MIKIRYIICISFSIYLLSCHSKEQHCEVSTYQILNLYPVDIFLKLPKYQIIDTTRRDPHTILNYTIQSLDSLISMNCFVISYGNDPYARFDIASLMESQRHEVEFNRNSPKLLSEKINVIDTLKVGYLKYLVQMPEEKFYEGRIFFYKEKKLVTIWLFEKYMNESQNEQSVIDCIANNMALN